jgi:CRISPR-associated protein Cmr5
VSSRDPSPAISPQTSLEQQRAAHALRAAEVVKSRDDDMKKAYRSYVERIGTTIITNGLGQALATELAAAGGGDPDAPQKRAHHMLYENLQSWLCRERGVLPSGKLLTTIVAISQTDYLRAQAEALAWLVWHKKLCRAFLPRGEGD